MEAIILAGGMGTRLQSVISTVPKPMAPIDNIPFIGYLFEYLHRHDVSRIILATGYMHEMIIEYYGHAYKDISIEYSVELEPLGTGGAVKQAMSLVKGDYFYLLNGDTFFNVDLIQLKKMHELNRADITLSLKPMIDFNRYGSVELVGSRIHKFNEKTHMQAGIINGGVYIASKSIFQDISLGDKFSFETDFLEKYVGTINIYGYCMDSFFIDIGIPEDYYRAQRELSLAFDE